MKHPLRNLLVSSALATGLAGALAAAAAAAAPADRAAELAWKFEYDDDDHLIQATDPGGRVTRFRHTFDEARRLRRLVRTWDDGSGVTNEFDSLGRLTRMADGAGVVSYGYDEAGRLNRVAREGRHAIAYTHDTEGRLKTLQVGDFYRVEYAYDYLGRLASLKTPGGPVTYEYQPGDGRVIRSLPNGVRTVWKRQPNGELEQITHALRANPGDRQYRVLAEYTYQHGPDGRLAAIQEGPSPGGPVAQYDYDTLGRLTGATGPGGQVYRYTYDQVGNRLTASATGRPGQTCTYDWAGRLASVDGRPCAHDGGGNLTAVTLNGVARNYRYFPDGRLAEVRAGDRTVEYAYDGSGRQILMKTDGREIRFAPDPLADGWQPLVAEDSKDGRVLIVWDQLAPLAVFRGGQVEWLLGDHAGSVRLVTDARGGLRHTSLHDPFGVPLQARPGESLDPGLAGLFWDSAAAGFQTLARTYVPELGMFLQPDPRKRVPSADPQSLSLYAYCGGDPVNFVDLNGEERTPADLRERGAEAQYRQADLRMRQQEMMDRMRQQQSEMRQRQQEMVERMRERQSQMAERLRARENPGVRQLREAEAFRDGVLRNYFGALAAEGLNVYGNLFSLLGGLPGALAGGLMGGVSDAVVSGLDRDVQARIRIQARETDDLMDAIGSVQLLRDLGRSFSPRMHYQMSGKIYDVPSYRQTAVHINTRFPEDFLSADGLIPTRLPGRRIVTTTPYFTRHFDVAGAKETVFHYYLSEGVEKAAEWAGKKLLEPRLAPGGGGDGLGRGRGGRAGSPLSPSTVGGVYLGGAGRGDFGLGVIKGVRTDANGNLVLIGEDAPDIQLPPLRLDDVVTVFRSVYLYGEGPTVTIDPNPENPEKSAMIIRHGEATGDTYVGWVLYQADRLMKSYLQGVDNVTEKDITSRVPGYGDVLGTVYFGGGDPRKSQKEGVWERFWIVPAEARRYEAPRRELTLLDIPLKVKTQRMKWVKDKLEDDLTGQSSPGATAFTEWFTRNYEAISGEQHLLPPPESGITTPVPVFAELRQIALITAVAEKLRDQEVPMPFWMHDHEVRKVPFERFTPGMEVTRRRREEGNVTHEARLFGGVTLSPETKAVKTFTTPADVAKTPPAQRAEVDRTFQLAGRLEQAVAQKILPVEAAPLTVHEVAREAGTFRAMAVPGAGTLALGPCRLEETDLVVPLAGGREIRLVRSHNSFFRPGGPWGRGWTMDLPRLQEIRLPQSREGGRVAYATGYQLLTPLNTFQARFREVRPVPELGGSRLQVPDQEGPFLGLAEDRPAFLANAETRVVHLRDGQEWHFSRAGDLVALREGPQVTVFERGSDGRVPRIAGLLDGALAARIDLEYRPEGTLARAVGRSLDGTTERTVEASYTYDSAGLLKGVTTPEGTLGYGYRDSRVATITWTDGAPGGRTVTLAEFDYNERGQMVAEKNGRDTRKLSMTPVEGGVVASVAGPSGGEDGGSARYDAQMRPVERRDPDGTTVAWEYPRDGSVRSTVTLPDRRRVVVTDSADQRKRTISLGAQPALEARYDERGQLTGLSANGKDLVTQRWRPDGQLAGAESGSKAISCQYGEQGLLSSVIAHPPAAGQQPAEWRETRLDRRGKPVEVRDSSGLQLQFGYDASGALAGVVQKTASGALGYRFERDDRRRLQSIQSSWGNTEFVYGASEVPQQVRDTRGGRTATLELGGGLVRKATGYDGGVTTFEYHDQGDLAGSPKALKCANGLQLSYEYGPQGRLAGVRCGPFRASYQYDGRGRLSGIAYRRSESGGGPVQARP